MTDKIRLRVCPYCGSQDMDIHDRESAWILGSCQTFVCSSCDNSGFVDFDVDPAVIRARKGAKAR